MALTTFESDFPWILLGSFLDFFSAVENYRSVFKRNIPLSGSITRDIVLFPVKPSFGENLQRRVLAGVLHRTIFKLFFVAFSANNNTQTRVCFYFVRGGVVVCGMVFTLADKIHTCQ